VLLFEADILYDYEAIEKIMSNSEKDIVLAAPISGSGDEYYICVEVDSRLNYIGNDRSKETISIGELAGIVKMSPEFLSSMYETATCHFSKNNMNIGYEQTIHETSQKIPMKGVFVKGLPWMEIDNKDDLKRAREIVYPEILRRKSGKDEVLEIV